MTASTVVKLLVGFALLLGAGVVSGCGNADNAATPASPNWLSTLAAAQQQAAQEGKRVVVVFSVDWSEPGNLFFAESIPHSDVRRYYDSYVWVRLDIERDKATSQQFRVYVAPSTVILDPSGQEVARSERFLYGPELADFLSQNTDP